MACSPDGALFATGSNSGVVNLYSRQQQEAQRRQGQRTVFGEEEAGSWAMPEAPYAGGQGWKWAVQGYVAVQTRPQCLSTDVAVQLNCLMVLLACPSDLPWDAELLAPPLHSALHLQASRSSRCST